MTRPIRIEYENAFYHVMNRGRGRQIIFHEEIYYQAFLDILANACERFDCIVHAYCLMGNHYHILIETPKANLSRVMRHVNGVYTQKHNWLKRTDGPLFRGRFKAILVDKDSYLVPLTRYIHRNPIDMKRPLVEKLDDYRWSSYPAYVGIAQAPTWLERERTYGILGHNDDHFAGYRRFVAKGVDENTASFYSKDNYAAIIGDKGFKAWIYEELLPELAIEQKSRLIHPDTELGEVTEGVARFYHCSMNELITVTRGKGKNEPRKIAMHLCQELTGAKLSILAKYFNLTAIGSVSSATHQIRKKRQNDEAFDVEVSGIITDIIQKAT
jgi:putative transposase